MAFLEWINDELTILAEAFGEPLTEQRQEIYCAGLADLQQDNLRHAFKRARYELKWFPKLAELREFAGSQAANDDRPGVEEAWAICPKSEEATAIWTEEIAEAFEVARPLLNEGNEIAARMAFKEKYASLLYKARSESKPIRWIVSLGWDKSDRVRALSNAVQKGRILANSAFEMLGPEQADEFLLCLPVTERTRLTGEVRRDFSQLTGLPRVLAELAEQKALPPEINNSARSTHRSPSDRSEEEVRRLREKVNAQIEFLKRAQKAPKNRLD